MNLKTLTDLPELDLNAILAAPDPVAALAEQREQGWAQTSPFGLHFLTYDDCFDLLRIRGLNTGASAMLDQAGISDAAVRKHWLSSLLGSPLADHDRMRRLLTPYFSKRSVAELADFATSLAERLSAAGTARGELEFVSEVASPLPPLFFCRMIGAPESDAPMIGAQSESILRIFDRNPKIAHEIEQSARQLLDYAQGFIDERRKQPRSSDMVSALLAAEDGGDRLSTHELRALVLEILEASTDNTASQLSLVLRAAAARPDDWSEMRRDPSLIPGFVEEASRLYPRIVHIARRSDEDFTFRDLAVPAGTVCFAAVPSANRDPIAYEDPMRFDMKRDTKRANLNFGWGGHVCIGAPLARMEMVRAMEVLVRRWERVELAGEMRQTASLGVVTIKELPLRITPAS